MADAPFRKEAFNAVTGLVQYTTTIVPATLGFSLTIPVQLPLLVHYIPVGSTFLKIALVLVWVSLVGSILFGAWAWARVIGFMFNERGEPGDRALTTRTMLHLVLGASGMALMFLVIAVGDSWTPAVRTPAAAIAISARAIGATAGGTSPISAHLISDAENHVASWQVTFQLKAMPRAVQVFVDADTGDVVCLPAQRECPSVQEPQSGATGS